MGFSQGAALAVMICMREEFNFDFAMFFAPFKSVCTKHEAMYKQVNIPALFVIGEGDQVIEAKRSDALLPYFSQNTVVRHEGGHFVPATSKQKYAYIKFLEDQTKKQ